MDERIGTGWQRTQMPELVPVISRTECKRSITGDKDNLLFFVCLPFGRGDVSLQIRANKRRLCAGEKFFSLAQGHLGTAIIFQSHILKVGRKFSCNAPEGKIHSFIHSYFL